MAKIYGGPSYQMGAMGAVDEALVRAAANAPITTAQAVSGKTELAKMRSSLKSWLKYRRINDAIASGNAAAIKSPILKTPGASAPPAAVMALRLRTQRIDGETELAEQLYTLLAEVFDPQSLPSPDVTKNPNAAVELAAIAIAGKLPGETPTVGAQGFVWMWPLVIVVGAIAFVITSAIRSSADVAKEKEKLECIKAGKCTDSGFWLKIGAIAVVGWIVWDKMGVGHRVTLALKKGR